MSDLPALTSKERPKAAKFAKPSPSIEAHDGENETDMANKNSHKKDMDGGTCNVDKDVGASNVDHEEKEVGIKPYVEEKLRDGRLVHQCCSSDSCPMSEGFIEKRTRTQDHLLCKHGSKVNIPKHQVGWPTNKDISARPSRCFLHPHAGRRWKKQVEQRSIDQEKKFEKNRREYKRLQHLLVEEAWNVLCDEFKTSTKEEHIATRVKERMGNYMSNALAFRQQIIACAKNTIWQV